MQTRWTTALIGKKGKVMSERGPRRRLSNAGLFLLTLLITVAMCALWVAVLAQAAEHPIHAAGDSQ